MPEIHTYPSMTTLGGTEIFIGNQSSVTSTATAAQIAAYAKTIVAGGLTFTGPVVFTSNPAGIYDELFRHFADVGSVTTGLTTLYTDTIPAGTLANNGDIIEIAYAGSFVASATATRTLALSFAATTILTSGSLTTVAADSWAITGSIMRESATVVRCTATLVVNGISTTTQTTYTRITGLTLSGATVLLLTGQAGGTGAATNDIVASMGQVDYNPA